MNRFTPEELIEIDALWRAIPKNHAWTGWAAAGDRPREIWIFRTKAHWRRFPLVKQEEGYALFDERDRRVATASSLSGLLKKVEEIPGIRESDDNGAGR